MDKMMLVLMALSLSLPAHAQPSPPTSVTPATDATAAGAQAAKDEPTNYTIENSLSIRDPFQKRLAPDNVNIAALPELERYDLDSFRLVGVITGPHRAKAMVTGPSNKMYVVEENTHIGLRHGFIKKIAPGVIYVEEKVINLLGQEESIETAIEFKDKKKE